MPLDWKSRLPKLGQTESTSAEDLTQKTSKPFISAIHDREIAKPSLFDGKLFFDGYISDARGAEY